MRVALTQQEIATRCEDLPAWQVIDGKLHREFRFENFAAAFAWMTAVAAVAEDCNHHPEWFNVWATVRVDLSTHDAGGLTELDFELARRMDALWSTR